MEKKTWKKMSSMFKKSFKSLLLTKMKILMVFLGVDGGRGVGAGGVGEWGRPGRCIIDSLLPAIHQRKSSARCCGVLKWNVSAAACTQTEILIFSFFRDVRVNRVCGWVFVSFMHSLKSSSRKSAMEIKKRHSPPPKKKKLFAQLTNYILNVWDKM